MVILVMVDEPRGNPYGGLVAGPVFSELGAWALNDMNIHPPLRFAEKSGITEPLKIRQRKEKLSTRILLDNGLLPNFTGESMREVLRKGRALGLKVVLEGTGLAITQVPEPGSPLEEISMVKVKFKPPG
jgi:cell division protein FtsI (penicillin-binding protein 3)